MTWTEECQQQIDQTLSQHDPKEVLAATISNLIDAKIESALYGVGLYQPSCDPNQVVDYNERLLDATLDRFTTR